MHHSLIAAAVVATIAVVSTGPATAESGRPNSPAARQTSVVENGLQLNGFRFNGLRINGYRWNGRRLESGSPEASRANPFAGLDQRPLGQ